MTDLPHDQLPQVTQIFINLGAPESQAQVMAAQLLKRAEQIAEERQISRVEATETLLKQVIEARQGA
ncbi:hypothetical protein ACWPKS_00420 [Coraliomargarita sp. W4R72]